jgi:hypothetical protein
VCQKLYVFDRCCSSVGALDIFILFLRDSILECAKKVLLPLEPKLLVMCERIGEGLKKVYSTCQFVKTMYLAPIGEALDSV